MLACRRKSAWDRYLDAAQRSQGAGEIPAPAAKEKKQRTSQAGRFVRAAARAGMAAARTAGGLVEFALWLGMNLIIILVIVLAAQAAGAKLPPWLSGLTNWVQGILSRLAGLAGF